MRQWMIDPKILCTKHLLGEHVEHHMFVGAVLKKKNLDGFLYGNLLEPSSLIKRHSDLVDEMLRRKFKHNSELKSFDMNYFSKEEQLIKIDIEKSLEDLLSRCEKCKERYLKLQTEFDNAHNIFSV